MKQKYLVIVLFVLIVASGATSIRSYRTTERLVERDMSQALSSALAKQQSDVITQDTIRSFNSYLQIAALRGKAILAVDTKGQQFKAYARCSEATIFSLSDQRLSTLLWTLTLLWAAFCIYRRRQQVIQLSDLGSECGVAIAGMLQYGGLCYAEGMFYDTRGQHIKLTHSLTKTEICDALWPKKPDASETLYTLIRRLKPVIEQHSNLKIESDRGRAYELKTK